MSMVEVFNSKAIMQLSEETVEPVETTVLVVPESLLIHSSAVEGVG